MANILDKYEAAARGEIRKEATKGVKPWVVLSLVMSALALWEAFRKRNRR